MMLPYINPF